MSIIKVQVDITWLKNLWFEIKNFISNSLYSIKEWKTKYKIQKQKKYTEYFLTKINEEFGCVYAVISNPQINFGLFKAVIILKHISGKKFVAGRVNRLTKKTTINLEQIYKFIFYNNNIEIFSDKKMILVRSIKETVCIKPKKIVLDNQNYQIEISGNSYRIKVPVGRYENLMDRLFYFLCITIVN